MKQTKWYFHLHHEILAEPLTEPLKNRIKYIKEAKPADEVELRLRLIKPVKNIPDKVVKARAAYYRAQAAYFKAQAAYYRAQAAYYKVLNGKVMRDLHKKECGCFYDFKNRTIFTKANGVEK